MYPRADAGAEGSPRRHPHNCGTAGTDCRERRGWSGLILSPRQYLTMPQFVIPSLRASVTRPTASASHGCSKRWVTCTTRLWQRGQKNISSPLGDAGGDKEHRRHLLPGRMDICTLEGHRSPEARATVEKFLDDHPDYPADLKLKILQAADHFFRQSCQ
jgi:hypothetical protein